MTSLIIIKHIFCKQLNNLYQACHSFDPLTVFLYFTKHSNTFYFSCCSHTSFTLVLVPIPSTPRRFTYLVHHVLLLYLTSTIAEELFICCLETIIQSACRWTNAPFLSILHNFMQLPSFLPIFLFHLLLKLPIQESQLLNMVFHIF